MKFKAKLVSLLLFLAFLGSIVPLTLKLLWVYDKANDITRENSLHALIWLGVAIILASISVTLLLILNKNETKVNTHKNEYNSKSTVENEEEMNDLENDQLNFINDSEVIKVLNKKDNLSDAIEALFISFSKKIELIQGVFYINNNDEFEFITGYALDLTRGNPKSFKIGDGVLGQSAKSKKIFNVKNNAEIIEVAKTGLGESRPNYILIVPIISKNKTIALMELGAFKEFPKEHQNAFEELSKVIAKELQPYFKQKTDSPS